MPLARPRAGGWPAERFRWTGPPSDSEDGPTVRATGQVSGPARPSGMNAPAIVLRRLKTGWHAIRPNWAKALPPAGLIRRRSLADGFILGGLAGPRSFRDAANAVHRTGPPGDTRN